MTSEIKPGFTRISAIAGAFASYGTIPPAVLQHAANRGGAAHKLILHMMACLPIGADDWMYKDQSLRGYIAGWERFYLPYLDAEVLMQEERLDDAGLMITGEPDLLIKHHGKTILMDWKCTVRTAKHWQIQAEGYNYLLSTHGKRIDKILFVRLDNNGKDPEVIEYKPEWKLFMKAYELYQMFFKETESWMGDE